MDPRSCSWPNNSFLMIIKYRSHAFVLCANKLIVHMQNTGNGEMMTPIAMLSFQRATLSFIVVFLLLSSSTMWTNTAHRRCYLRQKCEAHTFQHTPVHCYALTGWTMENPSREYAHIQIWHLNICQQDSLSLQPRSADASFSSFPPTHCSLFVVFNVDLRWWIIKLLFGNVIQGWY